MRLWFIIFLVFTASLCFGNKDDNVYLLTVPKSGTHCLEKYFKLLEHIDKKPPFPIRRSHVSESDLKLPKNYFTKTNVKKIILIRDPRDVFISIVKWLESREHYLRSYVTFNPSWKKLSLSEKVLQAVDYEKIPDGFNWKCKDRFLPQQVNKTIQKAIALSKLPNTLVVRYEDLSGGHGVRAQFETMRKINDFVGVTLHQSEYDFLIENLYGNKLIRSWTFREGKVYKWRKIMDESLQQKIWGLYGEAILDMGYDKY